MRRSATSVAARAPAERPEPPPSDGPRRIAAGEPRAAGRAGAVLAVTAAAAILALVVERLRPLPFGTTGDGPPYFAPLIELQTRTILAGHWPRMCWELGSGWTPFESGQVGLAYPGYLIAAVVARLAGHPLALLDVSAWLHLWSAGLACAVLLPENNRGARRASWAVLLAAQPAPFLLGLNWHDYLACYPWFLAMALLVHGRLSRGGRWARSEELALAATSAGFWMTAHPQMYVVGVPLLAGWTLALGGRGRWPALIALVIAQLPLVVPTLFLQDAATRAAGNWVALRGTVDFALRRAQALPTVAHGIVAGNLLGDPGFRVWSGVSGIGSGIFFAPWLLWSWVLAVRARRITWILLSGTLVGVLAVATFPTLGRLFPPALGLRWTWKLSLFVGPLSALAALRLGELEHRERAPLELAAVLALVLASAAVCVRGVGFELWPGLAPAHRGGLEGLVEATRSAARRAGVPFGARIAVLGRHETSEDLPVPYLGLLGDAPVLSGFESAHLYEPLESGRAAASHGDLSMPWRTRLDGDAYRRNPAAVETRLAGFGAEWIVTATPGLFPGEGTVEIRDPHGRATFFRRIAGAPPSFPYDTAGGNALERLPGGRLRSVVAAPTPPVLNVPRRVTWEHLDDGRWEGTPVVVTRRWLLYAALGLCCASLALLSAIGRGASPARSP